MPSPASAKQGLGLPPRSRAATVIKQWIGAGRLPIGERLPGEDQLGTELGVSRFTVHVALKDLAAAGVVRAFGKRGWIVPTDSTAIALRTVLALSPYGPATSWRAEPWSQAACHLGLMSAAAEHGAGILSVDIDRLERTPLENILGRRCDAVACLADPTDQAMFAEALNRAVALGLPAAALSDGAPPAAWDSAGCDQQAGAMLLVRQLVAQGRRRILVVSEGEPRLAWQRRRLLGYAVGAADAGLSTPRVLPLALPAQEPHDLRVRVVESHLREALAADPAIDALCAMTDRTAYLCAGALRRIGVEARVRVAGYDAMYGCPEAEAEAWSPLLTIDKRNAEVGAAVFSLIERRWNDAQAERRHIAIAPQVVEVPPRHAYAVTVSPLSVTNLRNPRS